LPAGKTALLYLYSIHTLVGQQRLGMGILEGLGILVGLGILEGGERRLARGGLVGWLVIFTGLPSLQPDVYCQLYSMKKKRGKTIRKIFYLCRIDSDVHRTNILRSLFFLHNCSFNGL
jgi:hypothetical protein